MAYYFSQAMVVGAAIAMGLSFFMKKQSLICTFSSIASIFFCLQYALLGAWTGVAVNSVAMIAYIVYFLFDRKNKKTPGWTLIILIIACITLGSIDYTGFPTVICICANCLFIFAGCESDELVFKIANFISSTGFLIYVIIYKSWFGVALQIVMLTVDMIAIVRYLVNKKKNKAVEEEPAKDVEQTEVKKPKKKA